MIKCFNFSTCGSSASQNLDWATSKGIMSAEYCTSCATKWWDQYKNTPAAQSVIITPVKHD